MISEEFVQGNVPYMDAIAVSLLVLYSDQNIVEQVVRARRYLPRSNAVETTVNSCTKREMSIVPATFGVHLAYPSREQDI